MNNKLATSISSLINWSDRIIKEGGRGQYRLRNFMADHNIPDYRQFYFELLPYLTNLTNENPELFQSLVDKYIQNGETLSEAMKENFLSILLMSLSFDLPYIMRSADDLVAAIKEIKANSENIAYSISISS